VQELEKVVKNIANREKVFTQMEPFAYNEIIDQCSKAINGGK